MQEGVRRNGGVVNRGGGAEGGFGKGEESAKPYGMYVYICDPYKQYKRVY
jgi:hypothetical protein